ncbi:hypothetical protein SAMN05421831_11226 [Allopseudospirillum japonicum]|uniref:2'-5' RNA ligase superfamily protein n=1 Tax=Allopseudospirillum japonicum TaxID=64971 RepID=A0A1H6TWR6_9GAMM|nr:2'-5' RNA ligase family protein [Allopseudospirillum japonicum]SEI83656.1 hypothetical protein SAMN05421831_11226 [Allopseudospirillum japonicum]
MLYHRHEYFMLNQYPYTLPTQVQDYPQWHLGRLSYALWLLDFSAQKPLNTLVKKAQNYLSPFLIKDYQRQPHLSIKICGFLTSTPRHTDDCSYTDIKQHILNLHHTQPTAFPLIVTHLASFASAPFLSIQDPTNSLSTLRQLLPTKHEEFRDTPYQAHITLGLYHQQIASDWMQDYLQAFSFEPLELYCHQLTLATYQSQKIAGPLTSIYHFSLADAPV